MFPQRYRLLHCGLLKCNRGSKMWFHSFVRTRKNVINPSEVHGASTRGRFYPRLLICPPPLRATEGQLNRSVLPIHTDPPQKSGLRVVSRNRNYLREIRRSDLAQSSRVVTLLSSEVRITIHFLFHFCPPKISKSSASYA